MEMWRPVQRQAGELSIGPAKVTVTGGGLEMANMLEEVTRIR